MDEKLSLEKQLKILYQEQSETENAYSENDGKINQSILVAWAQEILEREEKIKELRQKIAEKSSSESEKTSEETEEKRLVVVSKRSPWRWIMQKINQVKERFQKEALDLDEVPGLSQDQLQELREKRLRRYQVVVEEYRKEKNLQTNEKEPWNLTKEQETSFRTGEKRVLWDRLSNLTKEKTEKEKELGK